MKTPVRLLVAVSKNGIIGDNNTIPWKLKDDMKFFKEMTTGGVVIMGRKTWESLGRRPLPNRFNIVVTRDPYKVSKDYLEKAESLDLNLSVVSSVEDAIQEAQSEVWKTFQHAHAPVDYSQSITIIGGAEIYKYALQNQLVDEMYVTMVQDGGEVKGDATFYPLNHSRGEWIGATIRIQNPDERNQYGFHIDKWKCMKKAR